MVTSEAEVLDTVRQYVAALSKVIRVDRVILYGSHARGEADRWSDIDLLVLSRDFEGMDIFERQHLLSRHRGNEGHLLEIEALGKTPEEYDQAPRISFLTVIKRTGRVVYESEAA